MSECGQEMCGNWAGDGGCPCRIFDIDENERPIARESSWDDDPFMPDNLEAAYDQQAAEENIND